MNGKSALAPCGHIGQVVIGNYVQCVGCDTGKTKPIARTDFLCGKCGCKVRPTIARGTYWCDNCVATRSGDELCIVSVAP